MIDNLIIYLKCIEKVINDIRVDYNGSECVVYIHSGTHISLSNIRFERVDILNAINCSKNSIENIIDNLEMLNNKED